MGSQRAGPPERRSGKSEGAFTATCQSVSASQYQCLWYCHAYYPNYPICHFPYRSMAGIKFLHRPNVLLFLITTEDNSVGRYQNVQIPILLYFIKFLTRILKAITQVPRPTILNGFRTY